MPTDLELIKELEREIGYKLPQIDFVTIEKDNKNGYAINKQGQVIGLKLDDLILINNPKTLPKFANLKKLSLSSTKFGDYSFLSVPGKLTHLYLGSNKITDISFLSGLSLLTHLYLGYNQITNISYISHLAQLTYLNLRDNKIIDISYLSNLSQLIYLNLRDNKIIDISYLSGLSRVIDLDLRNNKIKNIPEAVFKLGMEINLRSIWSGRLGIFLFGNPIEKPPMEILRKGREAIKAYYRDLKKKEEKNRPLNEVKVLLVGDGGAGKTSLVKCLRGRKFDQDEAKTDGINIEAWQVKTKDREIKVNLWDFGGQEIMHATHQFFLSKRSLYILVLDGRKDDKTEYWLKHIESFGGDSPVLVVINKIDANPGFDVNRKFLREKYPNIKGFYRLSCANKEGMPAFLKALQKELSRIEMIQTTWPAAWFKVKTRLENMKENFISYKEFLEICSNAGIEEEENRETLVDFLHDLGVVLHFKDFELEDTHVLEPEWATGAVYKIINSTQLAEAKGILKLQQLPEILKKKKKGDFYYPLDKFQFIIELMKKFEICYEIDKKKVLVPDLLKVAEAKFDFDYQNSLKFVVEYDFLPKSVMPRFIVRMHKDIKKDIQWRTGVVLEDNDLNSTAVVKVDEVDQKVYIFVSGVRKREYFAIIRRTLRDINDSFEKLPVSELVPLPDEKEVSVEYKELLGHALARRDEIFIGKLGKSYSVSQLLDGIEKPETRVIDFEKNPGLRELHLHVQQQNLQVQKTETKVDVDVNIELNLSVELPALQTDFEALRDIIAEANPALEKKMKEIGDSLDGVGPGSDKEKFNKPFNKLRRFLEKFGDENSDVHKTLSGAKKALQTAQKVGRTYNKFAQWLGLPRVPGVLVGSRD